MDEIWPEYDIYFSFCFQFLYKKRTMDWRKDKWHEWGGSYYESRLSLKCMRHWDPSETIKIIDRRHPSHVLRKSIPVRVYPLWFYQSICMILSQLNFPETKERSSLSLWKSIRNLNVDRKPNLIRFFIIIFWIWNIISFNFIFRPPSNSLVSRNCWFNPGMWNENEN